MQILPIEKADRSLKWRDTIVGPKEGLPLAVRVNEEIYLVNDFSHDASHCLLIKCVNTVEEALLFSVEIYGHELTVAEWINVYGISKKLGLSFQKAAPQYMLRNYNESVEILDMALSFPSELRQYLQNKVVSWKTVALISLMPEKLDYIADYLSKSAPTVQQFKNFIELLRDFSDKINDNEYNAEKFSFLSNRLHPKHLELQENYEKLRSQFALAGVQLKFDEEASSLNFSFQASKCENYEKLIEKMQELKESVNDFLTQISKPLDF